MKTFITALALVFRCAARGRPAVRAPRAAMSPHCRALRWTPAVAPAISYGWIDSLSRSGLHVWP